MACRNGHAFYLYVTRGHFLSTSKELFSEKAATGIEGLDDILSGGLSRSHLFLLEGATIIALVFALLFKVIK